MNMIYKSKVMLLLMQLFLPVTERFVADGSTGSQPEGMTCVGVATFENKKITCDATIQLSDIGGLSGLEYAATSQVCYLITDDHTTPTSPRFYQARLSFSKDSLQELHLSRSVFIQYCGQPLKGGKQADAEPESIRWSMHRPNTLIWSTEKKFREAYVWVMDTAGHCRDSIPYAPTGSDGKKLTFVSPDDGTIEGLAINPDGRSVWIAPEIGFTEDQTSRPGAIRITQIDLKRKTATREFIYQLTDSTAGVSEILATNRPNQLLVLERRWNRNPCPPERKVFVSLYEVTLEEKTGRYLPNRSIDQHKPVKGKCLLNLTDYFEKHPNFGIEVDNVEGMAWGPTLSSGKRTLLFVTDNNYNKKQCSNGIKSQQTQLFAFTVPQ